MDAGKGYLFELVGAAWNEVDQLVSDDPEDERFGHEVALVAGLAVIGSGPAPGAMHVLRLDCLGTSYCAPTPNSTGSPGHLVAFGDPNPAKDNLTLVASQLPSQANIGYFIAGQGSNVHLPPGAAGPICIGGGSILRFLPPVSNTAELAGGFERNVGAFAPQWSQITTGSSWNFQAWHRDGTSPSNFTDAVNIVFR